ncbi:MAG: ATP-binding protein [Burkholderiaceae bacterium]|nr:ATP-binding protein [Aquabacterium sp.]NUP85562.1 ATP-binding protein [Burkholderiaceae bacterium]
MTNAPLTRQLDLFEALPPASEGVDLEFKAARGGLPGSFWETYSAMANTEGGLIVLGVAQRGGALAWEGVPDPAQLRTTLWNQINDRHKVSTNLLTHADVTSWERDGRQFVSVQVPRAKREQRPIYIGANPLTGTYRRAEDGDYHCSSDEVRRLLADQNASDPADARVLDQFGLADLDADTLRQYRNRFASRTPDHPWLSEDDAGLLLKLGGLRRDRTTGGLGLTVAGVLMFGSFDALREAMPSYHVDYREKLAADPAVRWTHRIHADGTFAPNLFQFYQRVRQGLGADIKLPLPASIAWRVQRVGAPISCANAAPPSSPPPSPARSTSARRRRPARAHQGAPTA